MSSKVIYKNPKRKVFKRKYRIDHDFNTSVTDTALYTASEPCTLIRTIIDLAINHNGTPGANIDWEILFEKQSRGQTVAPTPGLTEADIGAIPKDRS